jgi:DNA adenine methylase
MTKYISFIGRIGGKTKSADLIISMFPKNYTTYVEPFLGSGIVFFRKPFVDNYEILNDLDDDIYKVFKLVQSKNVNNIYHRTMSKDYFDSIKHSVNPLHILERLKNSFFSQGSSFNLSHAGQINKTDFTYYHDRLQNAKLLNIDFEIVMNKYDSPTTFFFLDPPYESAKKNDYKNYINPMDVYNAVKNIRGYFLLTYNDSPNIRQIFKNYYIKKHKVIYTHTQNIVSRYKSELIITNYR